MDILKGKVLVKAKIKVLWWLEFCGMSEDLDQ